MTDHKSDCAIHNEPAMPAGPCDCGAGVLEAMARAACAQVEKDTEIDYGQIGYKTPEDFVDACWPNYVSQQRAALTAALDHMWEPSHTVLLAGTGADPFAISVNDTADVWQAMLSQLRKETIGG